VVEKNAKGGTSVPHPATVSGNGGLAGATTRVRN
jgi:hypothetical protein